MPNLHPVLEDRDLPPALRRPLVFGDREQIEALQQVDAKIAEKIAQKRGDDMDDLDFDIGGEVGHVYEIKKGPA